MEFRRFNLNHRETPMTKTNIDLSELMAKHDQGDLLRSIAEAVLQMIMEADVDGLIGAGRHLTFEDRDPAAVEALLDEPAAPAVTARIAALRARSAAWLDGVLQ